MILHGRTKMSLGLMAISGAVFATAVQWPLKTGIFPMTIAIFTFVLSTIEVALGLFLKQTDKENSTMDFKLTSAEDIDIDEATARKRVVMISLWIFCFFALILLFGFPIATPLFFVLFLRIYAKESWKMTIILAVVVWLFFYGLFIQILHLPFGEGWVIQGLNALGILGG